MTVSPDLNSRDFPTPVYCFVLGLELGVGFGVTVDLGVDVGLSVGVAVGVGEGLGLGDAVGVKVGVGDAVGVAVGRGVRVLCKIKPGRLLGDGDVTAVVLAVAVGIGV